MGETWREWLARTGTLGRGSCKYKAEAVPTLADLLSPVDLGNLLFNESVALLADGDNLLARHTKLRDSSKHLFRDLRSSLVLGEGVGVVESVV